MSQTRAQLVKGLSNTSASDDALTVDSSGRLLINNSSSSNGRVVIEDTSFQVSLETGTAGDGRLQIGHFAAGAFIGTYGDDGGAADIIRFGTHSGDERMRILSAGGLTFNGDTAAANALDDYEEGTFTGRFNNSDDDATVSHGNQTGFYVKVGSLVHFSLYFDDIDVSGTGSTTNARIFGLPFTSLGTAQHYSVVNIIHNTIITSSAGAYVNTNSTVAIPTNVGTTTTSTFSTGTNFRLMIGGTYRAA